MILTAIIYQQPDLLESLVSSLSYISWRDIHSLASMVEYLGIGELC